MIKSLEVKRGISPGGQKSKLSSRNEGSVKESGVEQYESDDENDKSKQFYTSSAIQTSITRDGVMVAPAFSSAPN